MWSVAMIGSLPRRAESASLESRENVKRTAPVRKLAKSKVGASVARCPRTPPDAAKTPGLQIGLSNRVTRPEQPEHSCRLQLLPWPDNGGTMPSKSAPFTPSSILFRPRPNPAVPGLGGGAGYRPRVRRVYCDGHLSP